MNKEDIKNGTVYLANSSTFNFRIVTCIDKDLELYQFTNKNLGWPGHVLDKNEKRDQYKHLQNLWFLSHEQIVKEMKATQSCTCKKAGEKGLVINCGYYEDGKCFLKERDE